MTHARSVPWSVRTGCRPPDRLCSGLARTTAPNPIRCSGIATTIRGGPINSSVHSPSPRASLSERSDGATRSGAVGSAERTRGRTGGVAERRSAGTGTDDGLPERPTCGATDPAVAEPKRAALCSRTGSAEAGRRRARRAQRSAPLRRPGRRARPTHPPRALSPGPPGQARRTSTPPPRRVRTGPLSRRIAPVAAAFEVHAARAPARDGARTHLERSLPARRGPSDVVREPVARAGHLAVRAPSVRNRLLAARALRARTTASAPAHRRVTAAGESPPRGRGGTGFGGKGSCPRRSRAGAPPRAPGRAPRSR